VSGVGKQQKKKKKRGTQAEISRKGLWEKERREVDELWEREKVVSPNWRSRFRGSRKEQEKADIL